MVPSLELLANMSYQAKVVEIMAAHVHDVSILTPSLTFPLLEYNTLNSFNSAYYFGLYLQNLIFLLHVDIQC